MCPTAFKCVQILQIVSANYHDITRLLPLTIMLVVKIGQYRLLTKEISRLIGQTG